jgi:hypothetical protein
MFYMMVKHLSEAYKSIYQRKDLVAPKKDPEGMTGKMNPQGEPKAAQGGDHANAPESMIRGRFRAAYEEYKDELRQHHAEKFTKWINTLSEGGYDITKWEKEELIETYIKENNLWESAEIITEAILNLEEHHQKDENGKVIEHEIEEDKVEEGYKGKHGQTDKEYADSRSQGGKMISGDSKRSGAEYTHGRRVKATNPGMQPDVGGKTKPKSQGKMDKGTRADLMYRKANLKKEEVSDWRKDVLSEEEYDHWRDRQLEKYGSGWRGHSRRRTTARSGGTQPKPMPQKGKTVMQKETEKKYGKGKSALDIVKADIEKKHGKGAIMDTKKKKD